MKPKMRTMTAAMALSIAPAALAQYDFPFQFPVGQPATFYVVGPATGGSPDVQGDALLSQVEYPNGDVFIQYYKPVGVHGLWYSGDNTRWRVVGGTNTTIGLDQMYVYGAADGNVNNVTAYDKEVFSDLMLSAYSNSNLNNYVDLSGGGPLFRFVIEFDLVLTDNDPDPDDFGEILYFERGAGAGNSWLKMRAVDENDVAQGPWLVITPSETVQTTPVTTVYNSTQTMGTSAIDISRLGVTEVQYLEVSNDVTGESAYTGGGDLQPDFKIMAVVTNEAQLSIEGFICD